MKMQLTREEKEARLIEFCNEKMECCLTCPCFEVCSINNDYDNDDYMIDAMIDALPVDFFE